MRFVMGMIKKEFNEMKIGVEEVEAGINHLMKWGKKTFKDHTGEWVEVRCSTQSNFFDDTVEAIPHIFRLNVLERS